MAVCAFRAPHATRGNVRSRWQRSGDDAYDVVTEFHVKDRRVPGFSLHMQRERSSPT